MIRMTTTTTGFDEVLGLLRRAVTPDLQPLADRVKGLMIQDNREGLLAGTDADGSQTTDLRPSTLKRRLGDGPARVPHGQASRAISGFQVDILDQRGGGKVLIGDWPDFPQIGYMRDRNPVGIRPEGQVLIQDALNEFAQGIIGR